MLYYASIARSSRLNLPDREKYLPKAGHAPHRSRSHVRHAAKGMKPKNSLERVLAVLEVFSEERLEWTPEDLMRELGYSRPTLYRYLKVLKDAGFLMSTRNAGVTLGPKVVEMDYLCLLYTSPSPRDS